MATALGQRPVLERVRSSFRGHSSDEVDENKRAKPNKVVGLSTCINP